LAKWPAAVLGEGFVPFPKRLIRCVHEILKGPDAMKELAALLAIVDFKRPNLTRQPSRAFLAFLAGLEEQEFDRILRGLEQQGHVTIAGDADEMDVSLDGFLRKVLEATRGPDDEHAAAAPSAIPS